MDECDYRRQINPPLSKLHVKLLKQFEDSGPLTNFIEPLLPQKGQTEQPFVSHKKSCEDTHEKIQDAQHKSGEALHTSWCRACSWNMMVLVFRCLKFAQNCTPYTQHCTSHSHTHTHTHTQNCTAHTQICTSHTQNCTPHTQICTSHTQNSKPHPQTCTFHTQNSTSHTQNSISHTQNSTSHTQTCTSHTQICTSHTQICTPHTQNCTTHTWQALVRVALHGRSYTPEGAEPGRAICSRQAAAGAE